MPEHNRFVAIRVQRQPKRDQPASNKARHDRNGTSLQEGELPSEPPNSESSTSEPCNTTWIWSCGWQLPESDRSEVGDPPSGSGGFDGDVVEVAA